MAGFTDLIKEKMKEAPFIVLFLFIFGSILVIVGTAKKIVLFGSEIVGIDEFRLLIISMGFIFISVGIMLALVKKSPKEISISPASSQQPVNIVSDQPPFYTFHGLKSELRSDAVFQHFKINKTTGTNRNAVYYMWADTHSRNSIHASIEKNNNDGSFLHVVFNNNRLWLSNISIHPISEQAIDNQPNGNSKLKYRFLKILARAIKDEPEYLERISIVLRVCDRNLTYWEYANKPGEFIQLSIYTGDWQQTSADLENYDLWHKFGSDGNYQNKSNKPDFSVIAGVVLVLGGYNIEEQTPIFGKGAIDIQEILLDNSPAIN